MPTAELEFRSSDNVLFTLWLEANDVSEAILQEIVREMVQHIQQKKADSEDFSEKLIKVAINNLRRRFQDDFRKNGIESAVIEIKKTSREPAAPIESGHFSELRRIREATVQAENKLAKTKVDVKRASLEREIAELKMKAKIAEEQGKFAHVSGLIHIMQETLKPNSENPASIDWASRHSEWLDYERDEARDNYEWKCVFAANLLIAIESRRHVLKDHKSEIFVHAKTNMFANTVSEERIRVQLDLHSVKAIKPISSMICQLSSDRWIRRSLSFPGFETPGTHQVALTVVSRWGTAKAQIPINVVSPQGLNIDDHQLMVPPNLEVDHPVELRIYDFDETEWPKICYGGDKDSSSPVGYEAIPKVSLLGLPFDLGNSITYRVAAMDEVIFGRNKSCHIIPRHLPKNDQKVHYVSRQHIKFRRRDPRGYSEWILEYTASPKGRLRNSCEENAEQWPELNGKQDRQENEKCELQNGILYGVEVWTHLEPKYQELIQCIVSNGILYVFDPKASVIYAILSGATETFDLAAEHGESLARIKRDNGNSESLMRSNQKLTLNNASLLKDSWYPVKTEMKLAADELILSISSINPSSPLSLHQLLEFELHRKPAPRQG